MYKSASETTLKTSSTPNGTDNTDYSYQETEMRDAEAQALRWLEQGHDFILETWKLFLLEKDGTGKPSMLQSDLEALEKAHHRTGHGANDVEWAYGVLCSTRTEEAATPAVMIFLRTCPTTDTGPGAVWKIPEEIHTRDLLPYCADLAKWAAISWARGKLFDEWDEREKAKKAALLEKSRQDVWNAIADAARLEKLRMDLAAFQADAAQKEAQEESFTITIKVSRKDFMDAWGEEPNPELAWRFAQQKGGRLMSSYAAERLAEIALHATIEEIQSEKLECGPPPVPEEEHDPVLERLMAEARAIREAPLSAFAADAGFGEDGEEIQQTPPVPVRHYQADALEQFEDAAAWDRF